MALRLKHIALLLASAVLTFGLCSCAQPAADSGTDKMNSARNQNEMTSTHHGLVDTIYEDNENIMISPLSIDAAIALLINGAAGDTLSQLESFTGLDKDSTNDYAEKMYKYFGDRKSTEIANSIWSNRSTFTFSKDYRRVLEDRFGASANSRDFANPEVADEINSWCGDKTGGLITDVVEPDVLAANDSAIFSTLYFEDSWMQQIPRESIMKNESFTNADGSRGKVDMLPSCEDIYLENDKATGFIKPYEDGICFVGILPKNEGDFKMRELEIDQLLASQDADKAYQVDVRIPKFEIEGDHDLIAALKAEGATDIFDASKADLTAMVDPASSSSSSPYISLMAQKTQVKLDEKGTEAAAVTYAMSKMLAPAEEPEKRQVILNRPFAFLIYDTSKDVILFEGKVVKL